jgi:hypothetical protein
MANAIRVAALRHFFFLSTLPSQPMGRRLLFCITFVTYAQHRKGTLRRHKGRLVNPQWTGGFDYTKSVGRVNSAPPGLFVRSRLND